MPMVTTQTHWIDTTRGRLFAQSWTPAHDTDGAPLVLLHDSLGCVAMWRDFPQQLAQATGRTIIAYDRLGFGQSSAHPGQLAVTFIEDEATEGFQAVCQHFGLGPFWVLGHSVGGGMAVACAAAHPHLCKGVITLSAQAFVATETLDGIRAAKQQFESSSKMDRLAIHHAGKAQWVLRAWTDTWLSDGFRSWSLDPQLPKVSCPVLCLHGENDEFGSSQHPERIAQGVAGLSQHHMLKGCGHMPHREHTQEVLAKVYAFIGDARAI